MPVQVDIHSETATHSGDDAEPHPALPLIVEWLQTACDFLDKSDAEISVQIVSKNAIQALNKQYRAKDSATNVLSFPADLPDYIDSPLLGDIVLCAAIINEEAQQYQIDSNARWAHMLIHGTLHLCGFDHIEDQQREQMEAKEINILHTLGFSNPYEINE